MLFAHEHSAPMSDTGKERHLVKHNYERDMRAEEEAPYAAAPAFYYRDAITQLRVSLERQGYYLSPDPAGAFCGADVYYKVPGAGVINGLNVPNDFAIARRVEARTLDAQNFTNCIRMLCDTAAANLDKGDPAIAVWRGVGKDFVDRPHNQKTETYFAVSSLEPLTLKRTLAGRSRVFTSRVVPPVSWFPQKLQDFDCNQLLESALPAAESRMLELCFGRMLAGKEGTEAHEGIVTTGNFANFAVLIGLKGGEGKSTLLDKYVPQALAMWGYKVEAINAQDNQFSNGWITADYSYTDDINPRRHQQILRDDPMLKSVVSGADRILIQAKGIQHWEVSATSQPFFAANAYEDKWLIDSDAGMRRRYNPLQFYTPSYLQALHGEEWQQYRLRERWERWADELGCNVITLTQRFLRHCFDQFMSVTGQSIDEEGYLVYEPEKNRIEDYTNELKRGFQIQVSMEHKEHLMVGIETLCAAAIGVTDDRYRRQLLERIDEIELTPQLLYYLIDIHYLGESLPTEVQTMQPACISNSGRQQWKTIGGKLLADIHCLPTSKGWEAVISNISVSGKQWGWQKNISSYTADWATARQVLRRRVEKLLESNVLDTMPDTTYALVKECGQHLIANVLNINIRKGR